VSFVVLSIILLATSITLSFIQISTAAAVMVWVVILPVYGTFHEAKTEITDA